MPCLPYKKFPKKKFLFPIILLIALFLFFLLTYSYEPVTGYVDTIFDDIGSQATNSSDLFNDLSIYSGPNVNYTSIQDPDVTADEENFLTYLPHGGIHFQRVSLENAIFLANVTNRTLVIPPVIFGARIPYQTFSKLAHQLTQIGKEVLPNCTLVVGLERKEICQKKYDSVFRTLFPWDQLMDLSFVRRQIRIVNRPDFNQPNLFKIVNVTDTKQVYIQSDKQLYDFVIIDNSTTKESSPKFQSKLLLSDLQLRREKLLHFGSISSSARIVAELPENKKLFDQVRKNMIIGNSVLVGVVDNIVEQLGGLGSFVGLHIRKDNAFKNITAAINDVTRQLIQEYTPNSKFNVDINKDTGNKTNTEDVYDNLDDAEENNSLNEDSAKRDLKASELVEKCQERSTGSKTEYPLIYIATDAAHPKEAFAEIFSTFPCVYVLDDFSHYLESVKSMRNPTDNAPLGSYLLPLVDLMVSASGDKFIDTERSIFSIYAARLHEIRVGS
ncbi:hypothetical protein G9A89_013570 [Geosiphon pyriformis]|nr:hypothetical protein G9A89_013570 [Geosiphon pyriformis]